MEQRLPSALPLECPACGSRAIGATSVTATGRKCLVAYRCDACGLVWEHVRRPDHELFDPPPTFPAVES
jgi:uncharacterized Zn finger protein